jgi:hypothetical protein
MGTSTSYSAPPSWGFVKGRVTRAATGGGAIGPTEAGGIVRDHIRQNGGPSGMARGGSSARSGSVGSGRAAREIALRIGGFVSDVQSRGLERALEQIGLGELKGRPLTEVLAGLLDRLGGSAATIDDVDARTALSHIQDELLGAAQTASEVEQILAGQVANLQLLLEGFFGRYLYEQFCRVHFERLSQRVGEMRARSFLQEIESFIRATLANRTSGRDLSGVDWAGREGQALVADIMETTLKVFGE